MRRVWVRRGGCVGSWWGNRRERDHWGDLGVDGWIILRWISRRWDVVYGLQLVKKFPAFSRNPKVHYRTHKRPPPVCILGQPNPVHIPTSHLLEIHPNIIHPSTSRSPQWSLSLRFPRQDPIQLMMLNSTVVHILQYI